MASLVLPSPSCSSTLSSSSISSSLFSSCSPRHRGFLPKNPNVSRYRVCSVNGVPKCNYFRWYSADEVVEKARFRERNLQNSQHNIALIVAEMQSKMATMEVEMYEIHKKCSEVQGTVRWAGRKYDPCETLNGKPCVPVLNDRTLPKYLASQRLERAVNNSNNRLKIFSGTANPSLSQEIAWYMGLDLGKITIKRFADGEIYVQLQESVRGCDVYLVQPTCPPVNENLMELLIMIDACRRASAKTITAVIPYFGYARADRKTQGREAIAAKLVANSITKAGADRVLACDLHSGQSMGYFDIPVDHVYCQPVILDYLASKTICSSDLVVVSPDVGGVARARAFAKKLSDAPLAIVDKRRYGHNLSEVMNLIGDVKGKVAVMVDDMIDTAGTIAKGATLLHDEGAKEVYACSTHAVFSPPAIERLSSGLFQEVIVTNTIPVMEKNYFPELTVLSVANLLGETIWRVHDDCSVSSIFQ